MADSHLRAPTVVTAVAVPAAMASVFTHALGFLGAQSARGIEVESVPGSLLVPAEHLWSAVRLRRSSAHR